MVNKPKQIGTFAEVSVLQVLEPYYPEAKRIVQHGNQDEGDIDSGDGMELLFEVKGGKQCKEPIGPKQLAGWMAETDEERDRAGKTYGVLVTQRSGYGRPRAAHWWVYVHIGDLARIVGGHYRPGRFAVTRMELGDFLEILADHDLTADKEWPESGEEPPTAGPQTFTNWLDEEVDRALAEHTDRVYGTPEHLRQAGFRIITDATT